MSLQARSCGKFLNIEHMYSDPGLLRHLYGHPLGHTELRGIVMSLAAGVSSFLSDIGKQETM